MAIQIKKNKNLESAINNVGSTIKNGISGVGSNIVSQGKTLLQNATLAPRNEAGLRGVSNETNRNVQKYGEEYKPSEAVTSALADKQAANDAVRNYGTYNSQYQDQLNAVYDKIMNRKDFSYDLNSDVLYNQYKDQYQALGQTAMADTIGQASAMTGGYGNSYAANVGSQAYQSYLNQLNDKVPELYQLALQRYQMEGDNLYNQYNITAQADDRDYGRWADQYNRLLGDRDYYANAYADEWNRDYGMYADNRSYWQNQAQLENADYWTQKQFNYGVAKDVVNFGYNAYRDTVSDAWRALDFGYGAYRDTVADAQWNKTFNYNKERDAVADKQWQQSFDWNKYTYRNDFDYQKSRDAVSDSHWDKTFDYNAYRDNVADSQWQQTFDYNKVRDSVADSQWQQTFDYNKTRDNVADSQWNKEYGLKAAAASSSGTTIGTASSGSSGGGTKTVSSGGSTKSSGSSGGSSNAAKAVASNPTPAPKQTQQTKQTTNSVHYSEPAGPTKHTGVTSAMMMEVSKCTNSQQAANKIDAWEKQGLITGAEADGLYSNFLATYKSTPYTTVANIKK